MRCKFAFIVILCFSIFGCALFYPTKKPIDSFYYITGKAPSDTLIVMLPGSGDDAADFMKNGFIQEMNISGIRADAVAVDAHLGYYFKKNLLPYLLEDVILPARQKGYKNIWLLGISMGGLGAVIYEKHYPDTITGLILLAPFLGYPAVIDEVSSAGGLSQWSPKEPIDKDDYEHEIWKWLKEYTQPVVKIPRLVIGYGSEDRFAASSFLLSEVLPKEHVYMIPGGHDWETWRRLFHLILESGVISGQDSSSLRSSE